MRTWRAIYRLTGYGKPVFMTTSSLLPPMGLMVFLAVVLLVVGGSLFVGGLGRSAELSCDCPESTATVVALGGPGRVEYAFVTLEIQQTGEEIRVERRDLDQLEVGERVRVRFLDGVPITLVTRDGNEVDTEEHPVVVRGSMILGGAIALVMGVISAFLAVLRWLFDRRARVPELADPNELFLLKPPGRVGRGRGSR